MDAEQARRTVDSVISNHLESAGNLVSGMGEHELANQLWALAAKVRKRNRASA